VMDSRLVSARPTAFATPLFMVLLPREKVFLLTRASIDG